MPSRFLFDLLFPCILRTSLRCTAISVIGMGRQAPEGTNHDSPSVLACSRSFVSSAARVIPSSTSLSLRYPFSKLFSGRNYFLGIFSYERLDNLGLVETTLNGVIGLRLEWRDLCCFLFADLQLMNDNL